MEATNLYKLITHDFDSEMWSIHKLLKRNEFVDTLYTVNDTLYFVKEGLIKVCYLKEDKEIILAFGLKGELISDLFSFLTGEPSLLYLQAIKNTKLIGISKKSFNKLVDNDNDFGKIYRKTLESKIVEILQRQTLLFTKSPQQRVEETMKLNPELFRQVPRKYIAHYLGIAPETMSRLIK